MFQAAWPICNGGSAAGVPNLSAEIKPERARQEIFDIFYNGAATFVDSTSDMTTNWMLEGQWIPHSEGDKRNVWRSLNDKLGTRKFPNQVVY